MQGERAGLIVVLLVDDVVEAAVDVLVESCKRGELTRSARERMRDDCIGVDG